jgi:hypothetical protein
MGSLTSFHYLTEDILNKAQNESLYTEDGGNKDFDHVPINMDDLLYVKNFLEEAANEVFILLHKYAYEVTADDLSTVGVASAFLFDEEITGLDGNRIYYLLSLPDNFDTNLVKPLDSAIKRCLIEKVLYKWYDKRGRLSQKIIDNEKESEVKLRKCLNLKITISKTYRWY